MPVDPRTIKNILLVRNDRFGEFLLNIPALRAIKETFLDAKIIAVINPYVRELAETIPFINELIEWACSNRHTLSEKFRLIELLKKKNIDMAIMLNPSKEFNIISFLSGIPVRVGYRRKWGFLLTHKIKDKKYLGQKHEIEYNLELVSLVGAKTEDKTLSLTINNDIFKDFNIGNFDNLIALHPFTSDPIKQWPENNFQNLVKRLTEELELKLIIVGRQNEQDKSKDADFYGRLEAKVINLIGKTNLKQLAAVLRKCKLLISADSGPVHLACAVGTPVIAIFRNDIPGKSARRWGPWGEGHAVIEKNNLYDITVDEVFEKVKEILSR